MKAIKLFLVFAVMLAAVVGIFKWLNHHGDNMRLFPPSDDLLQEYQKDMEKKWREKADWDKDLFEKNEDRIRQLEKKYAVTALRDMNTRFAIEQIRTQLMSEWKSAGCQKQVVEKYVQAIGVVCQADSLAAADRNVQELKRINTVYCMALEVAHMKIGLTPNFDGRNWRSFDAYRNGVLQKKLGVLNDATYKRYLSGITEIKQGLNGIDQRLNNARSSFRVSLANSIIAHFKRIPPYERTNEQRRLLSSLRERYREEFGENSNLNSLVKQFRKDVDNNSQYFE